MIVITVEGGLVQGVSSDDPADRGKPVVVIDYDAEGADPEEVVRVEVKLADAEPSPHWRRFLPALKCPRALQLVSAPGVWPEHAVGDARLTVASACEALAYLP